MKIKFTVLPYEKEINYPIHNLLYASLYYLICSFLFMNMLHAMDDRSSSVQMVHQISQNCVEYTYIDNLTLLEKAILEDNVVQSKYLIRMGANRRLTDACGHNVLYMAAIDRRSVPLCWLLLTTCPSIKPVLKTVLLIYKRYGYSLPKDVLLNVIAPYIVAHAAQKQLHLVRALLTKKYKQFIEVPPYISDCRIVRQFEEERDFLYRLVEGTKLQSILNPNPENLARIKKSIIAELYASIGVACAI